MFIKFLDTNSPPPLSIKDLFILQRITDNQSMGTVHIPKDCIYIDLGSEEKGGRKFAENTYLFSVIL